MTHFHGYQLDSPCDQEHELPQVSLSNYRQALELIGTLNDEDFLNIISKACDERRQRIVARPEYKGDAAQYYTIEHSEHRSTTGFDFEIAPIEGTSGSITPARSVNISIRVTEVK